MPITIAIDGFSSCGKSTLAKDLALKLHYRYIDSGAMYRAVTLHFLRNQIDIENNQAVLESLGELNIDFRHVQDEQCTYLNGQNVEREIRDKKVTAFVSPVAAISEVRRFLVRQQQAFEKSNGIVMDGRDIGTVVYPNAELKLFLQADPEVRTSRRFSELQTRGFQTTRDKVEENLRNRDHIDSTRKDSPLTMAKDAVLIDNTNLTRQEQLNMVFALATCRIKNSEQ
jgi:cytidylate kinase